MIRSEEPQALYPMRVVTRLTGLHPDTIRAWERRYDAVIPQRTNGNTRMFSAGDVRRLSILRELVDHGHAIGHIASLSDEALAVLVEEHRAERAAAMPAVPPPRTRRSVSMGITRGPPRRWRAAT